MTGEVSEVSLKAFIDSTWFKGLARGAMILGAVATGYAGAALTGVQSRTQIVEQSVVEIKEAQAVRAKDNEIFQAATVRSFSDLDTEVAGVRVELSKVTSELGKITGILTEMQRQDVARVMRYDEGRRVP
jgi:hypothetical protein